ncbi:hypothetical protein [Hallella absiana]|nr:hypothetical protein [Hallella absiana]
MSGTGDWLTESITVLPTVGSGVSVRVYKQDGTQLFRSDTDEDGNPLVAREGGNDVFVIIASMTGTFTVKVLPYDEVFQNSSFQ